MNAKRQRKLLNVQLKGAVARCYKELETAYPDEFKKNLVLKVAHIFDVSETQIYTILKNVETGKPLEDPVQRGGRPKCKAREDVCLKEELAMRIHYYHENNMYFTMEDLYQYVRTELNYEYSKDVLYSIVKSMGYRYKKVNGRKLLVESPRLLSQKIFFLRKYQQYHDANVNFIFLDETWVYQNGSAVRRWVKDGDRKGNPSKVQQDGGKRFTVLHAGCKSYGFLDGCSFFLDSKIDHRDYHKTMNAEVFTKWVVDQLLPALKELDGKCVVVMDNAPYHSAVIDKPPSSNAKKAAMQDWLRQHNVNFATGSTRKELYSLIKPLAANVRKTYVIDEILRQNSVEVLRLPPYHCQYNPIEMAWGQCKQYYNKHIGERGRPKEPVQVLWEEALSKYGPNEWSNWVEHCERLIRSDWKKLMGEMSYEDIPPIIISLGESDSESDSSSSDSDLPNEEEEYPQRESSCELVNLVDHASCENERINVEVCAVTDDDNVCEMYNNEMTEDWNVDMNESMDYECEEIIIKYVSEESDSD